MGNEVQGRVAPAAVSVNPKLAALYTHLGAVAASLGHRVAGLRTALRVGDLTAAKMLLDRYLAGHKLPPVAASWQKLEAKAAGKTAAFGDALEDSNHRELNVWLQKAEQALMQATAIAQEAQLPITGELAHLEEAVRELRNGILGTGRSHAGALRRVYERCAGIAHSIGAPIRGLAPALAANDLGAARMLLDRYLTDEHRLPPVAASWQKLEKLAGEHMAECPRCKHAIPVLPDGRLMGHESASGISCPQSLQPADAAAVPFDRLQYTKHHP